MSRQAAARPDPDLTRVDRTGQVWLSHGAPFVVVGPPAFKGRATLHPIVWLASEGSVQARDRDKYPEFSKYSWEMMTYLERVRG